MMRRLLIALLMAPVGHYASAAIYFSSGPRDNRFPADMTAENANGVLPREAFYKHGFTSEGWTVESVDASSYSFVSPTYSGTDSAQESWLTTAPFTVEENESWLRWEAKSVLPGFPESYEVVVTETGTQDCITVAGVTSEESTWQIRLLPLDNYVGKEITVSFVCRSVNKYMLAVRNIYAGTFATAEWTVENLTSRYAAVSEGAEAVVAVTNIGREIDGATVVCASGGEEQISEETGVWKTSETRDFKFPLTLALDELTTYTIGIKDKEGNYYPLETSDVFASYFERKLVVDEGTGMWCNNCPEGILELSRLKREYKGNLIEIACHVNDPLELGGYWDRLNFYAIPYMMLNRNSSTAGSNSKSFTKEYLASTQAEVAIPDAVEYHDGVVELVATTRFANAMDNSSGRYRIGYTVTADIYAPDDPAFYQSNNLTFPRGEQYYILPETVGCSLARFENVALSDEFAFTGMEGSLPPQIDAMTDYTTQFSVTLPEKADNAENTRLVVFILDTKTKRIMNATASLLKQSGKINDASTGATPHGFSVKITSDRRCIVDGVGDDELLIVTVADASGRLVDSRLATRRELERTILKMWCGVSIVTVRSADYVAVAKVIAK